MKTPLGLYLHIPFCRRRCGYCDFNTFAGLESLIPDYVTALCLEIACHHQVHGMLLPVKTIYFGGGTPSLLPVGQFERLLKCIQAHFSLPGDLEISLEANPGTLSPGYLKDLRTLGFNRLSLGVQSFHPGELRQLDRQHEPGDVFQAVSWARKAGFDDLSLDLIFGLPDQEMPNWQESLETAIKLHPQHLSLYALSVEEGTPLASWVGRGLCNAPDPDRAADMYEWASERLGETGWVQYEISNWARQTQSGGLYTCQHNLQYWRNLPYLGFGAGAHGYAAGKRTANVLTPSDYIARMQESSTGGMAFPATLATLSIQQIDKSSEIGETMMMGLRLVEEGVSASRFFQRFGVELAEAFDPQIESLTTLGLIEWEEYNGERVLRLTKAGRLLANQVFIQFI